LHQQIDDEETLIVRNIFRIQERIPVLIDKNFPAATFQVIMEEAVVEMEERHK